MWTGLLNWSDDGAAVIAQLPEDNSGMGHGFGRHGLVEALAELGASCLQIDEKEVKRFVSHAKEATNDARSGMCLAERTNAKLELHLSEDKQVASLKVTGAYGGSSLQPDQIINVIQDAGVTKGINKRALKRALLKSSVLSPGEELTIPFAQGRLPVDGKDAQFIPLFTKNRSAVPDNDSLSKIDMLDRGKTLTVRKGQPLMRREPPTNGRPGITVLGELIPSKPGKDTPFQMAKGAAPSTSQPNILIATQAGLPITKPTSVVVDDVIQLQTIGVESGHIKFHGSVLVSGNIESDMRVEVGGKLIVGGFIESAHVEAGNDVIVAKGIIGHNVSEGEKKTCYVRSGGTITAHYAQYSRVLAKQDIKLKIHCLNCEVNTGRDLFVMDNARRKGTLGGGSVEVGGKLVCVSLGVEGNTPTSVAAFAEYHQLRQRAEELKQEYRDAQEQTMEVIRKEIAFKKRAKSERTAEAEQNLINFKQQVDANLVKAKDAIELHQMDFEERLSRNTIEVTARVYPHVTLQLGDERMTVSKEHSASLFAFDQYEIKRSALVE